MADDYPSTNNDKLIRLLNKLIPDKSEEALISCGHVVCVIHAT